MALTSEPWAFAAEIQCTFSNEYCWIQSFSAVTQPNEAITIAGKPSNYVNTNIMQLARQAPDIMRYFPTNFFKVFPNTVWVSLYNVGLTNLVPNAFGTCAQVGLVTLDSNNFPLLPSGFAQQCSQMTKFAGYRNNIQTLDPNALLGLGNLEELYLSDNNITCIPNGFFQYTPKMRIVNFRRNRLIAIDRFIFQNLPNLQEVDFQGNSLTYITSLIIPIPVTGFKMDLTQNKIYAIHPTFFSQFFMDPTKSPRFLIFGIPCLVDYYTCGEINRSYFLNCHNTLLQRCYSNFMTGVAVASSYSVSPPCGARL